MQAMNADVWAARFLQALARLDVENLLDASTDLAMQVYPSAQFLPPEIAADLYVQLIRRARGL